MIEIRTTMRLPQSCIHKPFILTSMWSQYLWIAGLGSSESNSMPKVSISWTVFVSRWRPSSCTAALSTDTLCSQCSSRREPKTISSIMHLSGLNCHSLARQITCRRWILQVRHLVRIFLPKIVINELLACQIHRVAASRLRHRSCCRWLLSVWRLVDNATVHWRC